MNTWVWGPPAWRVLHTLSGRMRTRSDIGKFGDLLKSLADVLPCKYCRGSWTGFLNEIPRETEVVERLYLLHEKVSDKLDRQNWESQGRSGPFARSRRPSLDCLRVKLATTLREVCPIDTWTHLEIFAFGSGLHAKGKEAFARYSSLLGQVLARAGETALAAKAQALSLSVSQMNGRATSERLLGQVFAARCLHERSRYSRERFDLELHYIKMDMSATRQAVAKDINSVQAAVDQAEKNARSVSPNNDEMFVWVSFDKLKKLRDKVDVKKIGSGANANVFSACPKGKNTLWKNCMVVKPVCTNPVKCLDGDDRYLKDVPYEEANATQKLGALSRNIVRAYHVTGDPKSNSAVLYLEALGPWKGAPTIGTLAQAAKNSRSLSQAQWASVLFQAMFAIAKIQKNFPGFRHNDLHGGNLMLTRWGAESPTYRVGAQCFGFPRTFPRGVLIDFGWSTQARKGGALGITEKWEEIKRDFGKHLNETRYIEGRSNSTLQQSRDFAMEVTANEWIDIVNMCLAVRAYSQIPWNMLARVLFAGTRTSAEERSSIVMMLEENETAMRRLSGPAQKRLLQLVKSRKVSTLVNAFQSDVFDSIRVQCPRGKVREQL